MKIGIIGAGQIGSTLARGLTGAGHEVLLANSRGPDTIANVAKETGATATTTASALDGVDVVVVTIPMGRIPDLPSPLFSTLPNSTVVVDTCNYYPERDGSIAALEQGMVESNWVADQLGRRVVKAFNNIGAHSLGSKGASRGAPSRIGLPVAGDRADKLVVAALVDAMGFDDVDGGSLDASWRQQPGSAVYCTDYSAAIVAARLDGSDKTKLSVLREAAMAKIGDLPPDAQPGVYVAVMRSFYDHA